VFYVLKTAETLNGNQVFASGGMGVRIANPFFGERDVGATRGNTFPLDSLSRKGLEYETERVCLGKPSLESSLAEKMVYPGISIPRLVLDSAMALSEE